MKIGFQRIARLISAGFRSWRGRRRKAPPAALLVGDTSALGLIEPPGLAKASNFDAAISRLEGEEIPVVLLDQDVRKDWRCAVRRLAHTASRPSVVVLTASKPQQLWAQVTEAGGYDVVRKPAVPGALSQIIQAATVYWRCNRALDPARRTATR